MSPRPNFVADERFAALRPALEERLHQVAAGIRPEHFKALCPPLAGQILRDIFQRVGASEGSVWLLDETQQFLVNAFNTGPRAAEVEIQLKLPISEGLLSMVLASEQAYLENEVYKHRRHSKLVDAKLGQVTLAMIAVPFYLLQQCRGVISCVHLGQPGETSGAQFEHAQLTIVQRSSAIVSDLLDYQLLRATVGWKTH